MVYKVLEKGSGFMKIQLAGASGRRYDVKVNNVTKSNVTSDATVTFTGLSPGVNYTVDVYLIPREYFRVVIKNNSAKDALNFTEVEVIDYDGRMVSRIPSMILSVVQTDTAHGGHPSRAVNGNKSTWIHTRGGATKYWVLNFKTLTSIKEVRIYNRKDCCQFRLKGCLLMLDNSAKRTVFSRTLNGNMTQVHRFDP